MKKIAFRTSIAFLLMGLMVGHAYADTCQPTDLSVFQVMGVKSDDTLNVRSGPTTEYPVVTELSPTASNVRYAGDIFFKDEGCRALCQRSLQGETSIAPTLEAQCFQRNQIWFKIFTPDNRIGWASSKFLMELPQIALSDNSAEQATTAPVSQEISETINQVPATEMASTQSEMATSKVEQEDVESGAAATPEISDGIGREVHISITLLSYEQKETLLDQTPYCSIAYEVENQSWGTLYGLRLDTSAYDDRGAKLDGYGFGDTLNPFGSWLEGQKKINVGTSKTASNLEFKGQCQYIGNVYADGVKAERCNIRMMPEAGDCFEILRLGSKIDHITFGVSSP